MAKSDSGDLVIHDVEWWLSFAGVLPSLGIVKQIVNDKNIIELHQFILQAIQYDEGKLRLHDITCKSILVIIT